MVRRVSSIEARTFFAHLIESIEQAPVIIEQEGNEVAVIISPDDYRRLQEYEARDWDIIMELQERNEHFDPSKIYRDTTQAVSEARGLSMDDSSNPQTLMLAGDALQEVDNCIRRLEETRLAIEAAQEALYNSLITLGLQTPDGERPALVRRLY
jgi:prevent-host-death family protein